MTSPLTSEMVDYAAYCQTQARGAMLAGLIVLVGVVLLAAWRWLA